MHSAVVAMVQMTGNDTTDTWNARAIGSCLDAYATGLHTSLAVLQWYPELHTVVAERVGSFVRGSDAELNTEHPGCGLGQWLPLFAMCDQHHWTPQMARTCLHECLVYGAQQVLAKHEHLQAVADRYLHLEKVHSGSGDSGANTRHATNKPPVRKELLALFHAATITPQRELVMHVILLRLFRRFSARPTTGPATLHSRRGPLLQCASSTVGAAAAPPPGAHSQWLSTHHVFAWLNGCCGHPSTLPRVMKELRGCVVAMRCVGDSWTGTFRQAGLTPPSPSFLSRWLVYAIRESECRQLHHRRVPLPLSPEKMLRHTAGVYCEEGGDGFRDVSASYCMGISVCCVDTLDVDGVRDFHALL